MELFSNGEGETVTDEGMDWVRFLESRVWAGRVIGFDIVLLTSREPGVFPNELDLSIDELVANFSGLGPLDVRGDRSISPNSDGLGILLSAGLGFNVRGPGVDGREG